jgi:DNA-binding LacI/PurR family transcriptional regulator
MGLQGDHTDGLQRGFVDAMAGAGLSEISLQVDGLRSEQQSYTAVAGLMRMDNPPTALYTSHHLVTLGARFARWRPSSFLVALARSRHPISRTSH